MNRHRGPLGSIAAEMSAFRFWSEWPLLAYFVEKLGEPPSPIRV
jgi:hypothetical protein